MIESKALSNALLFITQVSPRPEVDHVFVQIRRDVFRVILTSGAVEAVAAVPIEAPEEGEPIEDADLVTTVAALDNLVISQAGRLSVIVGKQVLAVVDEFRGKQTLPIRSGKCSKTWEALISPEVDNDPTKTYDLPNADLRRALTVLTTIAGPRCRFMPGYGARPVQMQAARPELGGLLIAAVSVFPSVAHK